MAGNIAMARNKYRLARAQEQQPRVAVCGWDLAHNAAGRVYTLAKLYETFAEVEIIGSIFPAHGRQLWKPIQGTAIPVYSFIVEAEESFIEQALQLVSAHPYDIVHLSKPRMPNIIMGILYKQIWDAQVLVDIDDEELAFVDAVTPISLDDYLKQHTSLPALQDLSGTTWTRLAVGLANTFDGITTANPTLQQRYGGDLIRHARDEIRYQPTTQQKQQSRTKFSISQDKKVVLFFGTPRAHKGLLEISQAIAALKREDIVFAIVGDFPDPKLKDTLQGISGVDYAFIGNQPFGSIPEVVAMADVCVLLQDTNSVAAQFQVPAKLSDALAMRIPVLASETPVLADAFLTGALQPVNLQNLAQQLAKVLDLPHTAKRLQDAGHTYFQAELTYSVNQQRLLHSVSQHPNRPLSAPVERIIQAAGNTLFNALLNIAKPITTQPGSPARQQKPDALLPTQKIAVVVHVYYRELWPEIAQRLKTITYPYDLFITTTDDKAADIEPNVIAVFPQVRIHIQPPAGMDVLPFLGLSPTLINENYLAVCKLHTKRGT